MREVVITEAPESPPQMATVKLPYTTVLEWGAFYQLVDELIRLTDNFDKYTSEDGFTYIENIEMDNLLVQAKLTQPVQDAIVAVWWEIYID